MPAKTGRKRLRCFKTLHLSQSPEHYLNCQLWALSRQSFKLRYPIKEKKSALFAKYYLLNLDKNKNDRFWRHRKKQQPPPYLPSGFLHRSSLQDQKSVFTVKFNPCSSLEVTFFCSYSFPVTGVTVFCSSASWPCLDFQHHDCIACWEIAKIFYTVHFFSHSCLKNPKKYFI